MIRVYYAYQDAKICYLEAKGHANQATSGKDIVCSAVSAILLGGLNALNDENFEVKTDEGYVLIKANNQIDEHDAIVLETLLTQLKSVAESYGKYVQIERKEQTK